MQWHCSLFINAIEHIKNIFISIFLVEKKMSSSAVAAKHFLSIFVCAAPRAWTYCAPFGQIGTDYWRCKIQPKRITAVGGDRKQTWYYCVLSNRTEHDAGRLAVSWQCCSAWLRFGFGKNGYCGVLDYARTFGHQIVLISSLWITDHQNQLLPKHWNLWTSGAATKSAAAAEK